MSLTDPHWPSLTPDDVPTETKTKGQHRRLQPPAEMTALLNPAPRTRLFILLSFPLLFLLAIPFWWYTTSIERLPLPANRIDALENVTLPDIRSRILFTADAGTLNVGDPVTEEGYEQDESFLKDIGKEVMSAVDATYAGQRRHGRRDWELVYHDDCINPIPLRVHLRRSPLASHSMHLAPYISEPESGLMSSGLPAGTLVIPIRPRRAKDKDIRNDIKETVVDALARLYPSVLPDIPLRALKYSPNITLSFVLLNEDAAEGSYVRSWDIQHAIEDLFIPHLDPLSPIFNFTIESQLLYHAPLSFEPSWGRVPEDTSDTTALAIDAAMKGDGEVEEVAKEVVDEQKEEAWLIGEEEMKVFINSEKWSLDSGSTNNPVLRFLLYVPAVKHRPLRLAVPDSAQSFLVPQFGGVVLLSPPSSADPQGTFHLPLPALTPSFHLFTQHLYSLLALPTLPKQLQNSLRISSAGSRIDSEPTIPLLSPWQIHQVLRARATENSIEARKTLKGISRLVKKIREMKVGEGVRGKVLGAVERLERIPQSENMLEIFILTRDAVGLANEAFFDPSMMGLLYFPDEHKFAVYTPLFAPVAVPLIVGLLKELLAWRKRRRGKSTAADAAVTAVQVDDVPAQEAGPDMKVTANDDTQEQTSHSMMGQEGSEAADKGAMRLRLKR